MKTLTVNDINDAVRLLTRAQENMTGNIIICSCGSITAETKMHPKTCRECGTQTGWPKSQEVMTEKGYEIERLKWERAYRILQGTPFEGAEISRQQRDRILNDEGGIDR